MQSYPSQLVQFIRNGRWPLTSAMSLVALFVLLTSCSANRPPTDADNICSIFEEKPRWYKAAKASQDKWGTPIHVQMAIIRQESTFQFDARPPRKRYLGFIPGPRASDAYGYAQVKDATWDWYIKSSGNRGADRDDFSDAIDFVGWYTQTSQKSVGISKWDPYGQYLAYHEGHGGYKRGSYEAKKWLKNVARAVDTRAKNWGAELKRCEGRL